MNRPGMLHPNGGAVHGKRDVALKIVSAIALVPALILVSFGVADRPNPGVLVHPVLVMGGLFIAIVASFLATTQWELQRLEGGGYRIACTIRLRPVSMTILVLGLGLLAVIAAYLFVENFQPRVIG